MNLGDKEVVYYSSDSELIFVQATPDHVRLITELCELMDCNPLEYDAHIELRRKPGANEDRKEFVTSFQFPVSSGEESEIAVNSQDTAGSEKRMRFEFIMGPDGKTYSVVVSGKLPLLEENISLNLKSFGELGQPLVLFRRTDATGAVDAVLTVNSGPDQTGSEEWKREKTKVIKAELEKRQIDSPKVPSK